MRQLLKLAFLLLLLQPRLLCAQFKFDLAVRDYVQQDLRRGGEVPFLDAGKYVQYVPSTLHLGLGLSGVPAHHSFVDRSVESALAHAFCFVSTQMLKYSLKVKRPDSDARNSFPSGHTALAFTGAGLVRIEYGWGWGSAACGLAAFVAAERVWGDRHYLSDVLAGAALGILSAHAGCYLREPAKQLFGIKDNGWDALGTGKLRMSLVPAADPVSGTFSACFAVNF